jgi:2-iminobutanoate/2-iminopropanoate deaminase
MKKQEIRTESAPVPVGPYSQAVAAGGFIFCSGQLAFDPATKKLVTGDIAAETRQVMENLRAVLAAAGKTFDDVVKTTIYLMEMGDFPKVNEVYGGYFTTTPPARVTVQVSALPAGARVEIECIAII